MFLGYDILEKANGSPSSVDKGLLSCNSIGDFLNDTDISVPPKTLLASRLILSLNKLIVVLFLLNIDITIYKHYGDIQRQVHTR